jgi:hypothetical protein
MTDDSKRKLNKDELGLLVGGDRLAWREDVYLEGDLEGVDEPYRRKIERSKRRVSRGQLEGLLWYRTNQLGRLKRAITGIKQKLAALKHEEALIERSNQHDD